MKKIKHFTIKDNIFMAFVQVIANCSNEYFDKYVEKKYNAVVPVIPGAEGNFLSFEVESGIMYFLWLKSFTMTPHKIGVLNHEILHCAYSILTNRGIEINDETEEVLTYYHTYLFTEALKKLSK